MSLSGEKSSGEGTITDMDGNYKLSTSSANPVLVFSYCRLSVKRSTRKGNVANVVLEDATQELNEVVVTALGIKRAEKGVVLQCTTSQGRCFDYGKRC